MDNLYLHILIGLFSNSWNLIHVLLWVFTFFYIVWFYFLFCFSFQQETTDSFSLQSSHIIESWKIISFMVNYFVIVEK